MRKYSPHGPLVNSEFYPGWLPQWTGPFPVVQTELILRTMEEFFKLNVSFNFYMFHNGTSFVFKSGKSEPAFGLNVTRLEWNRRRKESRWIEKDAKFLVRPRQLIVVFWTKNQSFKGRGRRRQRKKKHLIRILPEEIRSPIFTRKFPLSNL